MTDRPVCEYPMNRPVSQLMTMPEGCIRWGTVEVGKGHYYCRQHAEKITGKVPASAHRRGDGS